MLGRAGFVALQVLAFVAFLGAICASAPADQATLRMQPELGDEYEFTVSIVGGFASGSSRITANGQSYELFRRATDGFLGTGFGLQIDRVLGAVVVPYPRRFYPALGMVIYRIDGGSLKGFRLPEAALQQEQNVGREELAGPPGLDGRYEIVLSENPFGQPYYTGYVEIKPYGDAYRMHWYTPQLTYAGTGVKLGNVFVAAYSLNEPPPGVVAYCVGPDWLIGVGARSDRATLSYQTMHRMKSPLPPWSTVRPPTCP
jgi:hypothetical protein